MKMQALKYIKEKVKSVKFDSVNTLPHMCFTQSLPFTFKLIWSLSYFSLWNP